MVEVCQLPGVAGGRQDARNKCGKTDAGLGTRKPVQESVTSVSPLARAAGHRMLVPSGRGHRQGGGGGKGRKAARAAAEAASSSRYYKEYSVEVQAAGTGRGGGGAVEGGA